MKKIGILTWYKALNHGAVLQTYASCKMIEAMNAEPVVLNYDWQLDIEAKENQFSIFLSRLRRLSPSKLNWYIHVKKNFAEKQRVFNEFVSSNIPIGNFYNKETGLNAVYIGSDMVFDLTEGYNPYMYGYGVNTDYVFSYAASFGYTSFEDFLQHKNKNVIVESLRKFKAIGYRDENTRFICDKVASNVPMTENIDPVLCYGFEDEITSWDTGKWSNQKYLLVYAYDSTMNDAETVKQIKRYAKSKGLKIVSCGYYHRWCDEVVCASPKEFVEMIHHADVVVTDTFHGTVFSLIMHKNFASIIRKNGFKLRYLLECGGMEDRIVNNSLANVLDTAPNYSKFDKWLLQERNKSQSFIRDNIEKC